MKYSLSGEKWQLMGHWPYTPLQGRAMETGGELQGITDWIPARVPGSVQADLLRAGLLPDPYFGMNSLQCEWVENRWWRYRCTFRMPENVRTERVTLDCAGIDYAAYVYLNHEMLAWHEGMYDPVCADITARVQDENLLEILIEAAPKEQSQIGYTSLTETQKARFGYKWDFCTHLVNLGVWEDVCLNCTGPYRLKDVFIRTGLNESGEGVVRVSGGIDGLLGHKDASLRFVFDGTVCDVPVDCRSGLFDYTLTVSNPKLWNANGLGAQPLYEAELILSDALGVSDTWQGRVGIRSLSYRQNDGAGRDSLPYTVVLNGAPVYLKGVNMTPLSHFYGALTREDYVRVLSQARNMGVNLIRVWGGGICEKEWFYDLCDEYGILVWQEFIQSSSGLDNVPSKKPHFLELLKTAAEAMLKGRRNYTCHTFWSGGNELMNVLDIPADYGDENIAMLHGLCSRLDPDKLFLPTSASGPTEWLLSDQPGRNHDIHGNWKYEGIPDHYTRSNISDSLLHSEFGCEGLSSMESLKTVLPEDHLKPTDMDKDLIWRFHGEWWDCYGRDTGLFGKLDNLESWILLSQFVQAESIRYTLEANRRRKYRNCGSFIWQLHEPWPNTSCTCLLEHSGRAKMAAYAVKKAYAPRSISLKYDTLIFPADEPITMEAFVSNSLEAAELTVSVELRDINGRVFFEKSERLSAAANACAKAFDIEAGAEALPSGLFWAVLKLLGADGSTVFENTVLFTQARQIPFAALQSLPEAQLSVRRQDDDLIIENTGIAAALFVYAEPVGHDAVLTAEDAYFTLFPQECRVIRVSETNNKPLGALRICALNANNREV